jgi:hypothetical protein
MPSLHCLSKIEWWLIDSQEGLLVLIKFGCCRAQERRSEQFDFCKVIGFD